MGFQSFAEISVLTNKEGLNSNSNTPEKNTTISTIKEQKNKQWILLKI
ncbi:hypothetical protein GFO_1283 [Christiangramia forsetii KT0803]|uniref:Uncharacterized protein n=1 Tax=Christiangramia forsetii (strain DSM 17595 / CGMCC 1.15422 / KT0803) TaxID=411154 RepID=A0M0W2_CHRFK|nr:hypothetical protein GFO_1283 [Christiangramia forsetii KT0803]